MGISTQLVKNIYTRSGVSWLSQACNHTFTRQGSGTGCLSQQQRQGNTDLATQKCRLLFLRRKRCQFKLKLLITCLALFIARAANAIALDLDHPGLSHIVFKHIAANNYQYQDGILNITVNQSASFLLLPLSQQTPITSVSFQWKKQGELRSQDAKFEESKEGDDAYLRIGLMLKGEARWLNPLAPKWIKQVKQTMQLPSEKMIYLVAGSKHQAGQQWLSPFSEDIEIIAVDNHNLDDGWIQAQHNFNVPMNVVGIWIMADGDNTGSSFISSLRSLQFGTSETAHDITETKQAIAK